MYYYYLAFYLSNLSDEFSLPPASSPFNPSFMLLLFQKCKFDHVCVFSSFPYLKFFICLPSPSGENPILFACHTKFSVSAPTVPSLDLFITVASFIPSLLPLSDLATSYFGSRCAHVFRVPWTSCAHSPLNICPFCSFWELPDILISKHLPLVLLVSKSPLGAFGLAFGHTFAIELFTWKNKGFFLTLRCGNPELYLLFLDLQGFMYCRPIL